MSTQPQYVITLRSLPNARTTPEQRLKHVLKRLLRSYQFQCVTCKPITEKQKPNL